MTSLKTPYANLLPPLAQAEFDALRASIKANGVHTPIIVDEEGNILDGHHRHQIKPDVERRIVTGLSEASKRAFVIACNLQRRNLSPDQKIELRETQMAIAADLKAEGQTQNAIAVLLGVARETVRDWLTPDGGDANARNLDARVKLPQPAKLRVLERVEANEPQRQIAADFGVSQQHVSRVAKAERKRLDRMAEIETQRAAIARGEVAIGRGPYEVIVYDPPWDYGDEYDPEGWRGAPPYPTMSLEEIAADFHGAADDCVLWLWTTHRFMRHSFGLLDGWGFQDKSILTWCKDRFGLGKWLRSQSEFCIMATRGQPKIHLTNQTTVLHAKMREHSRKPDEFYTMVESLCLGSKYDRFGREQRPGWIVGGNDTRRFDRLSPEEITADNIANYDAALKAMRNRGAS